MTNVFDPANVRPGDIYEHHFPNDQAYGYSIPVKTSRGWDLIDTYQLSHPSYQDGETSDQASIRRVIELASTDHDFYASRCANDFYHRNITCNVTSPLKDYVLVGNLDDFRIGSNREADDYALTDVLRYIPLYFEQHYSWNFGRAMGLTFIRKGARPKPERKLKAFLADIDDRCGMVPDMRYARYILEHDVTPLIQDMTASDRLSAINQVRYEFARKRIEAIEACYEAVEQARSEYHSQLAKFESESKID